jgi:hypothetical protein
VQSIIFPISGDNGHPDAGSKQQFNMTIILEEALTQKSPSKMGTG